MKNIILILGLLFAINVTQAQDGPPRSRMNPEERAKNQVDRLDKELTLSQEQKDSILVWSKEESASQQEFFKNREEGGDRKEMGEKMMAIRKATQTKIASILTPEQKVKYEELQKKMERRRPGGPRGGNDMPPPPPAEEN